MTENVNFHFFEYACERESSILKKSKPRIFAQASKDQIFSKMINLESLGFKGLWKYTQNACKLLIKVKCLMLKIV